MSVIPPLAVLIAVSAAPAIAQTIDARGISAGGVRIDASGVHAPGTDVGRDGVRIAHGPHGSQVINGNGQQRSISCASGTLTVNGNANQLSVSNCRSVWVLGNDNRVSVRFTANGSLQVPGNHNIVSWSAAPGVVANVSSLGSGNHVARR